MRKKWKLDPDIHLPLRDHVRSKELAKAMRPKDLELPPPERDPRAPVTFCLEDFTQEFKQFDWVNMNFNNKPKWLRQFYRHENKQVTLKKQEDEEIE
tara:strand:+ start:274 stop:564 length:291 start_codon:yes stop_codon:yes gene_type:complete